jgi:alpha-beta hydrolase superfamily lysophospholipase
MNSTDLSLTTTKLPATLRRSRRNLTAIALLFTLLIAGCRKEPQEDTKQQVCLFSSAKIGDFTKEQLDARYSDKSGVGFLAALDKYDISVYKIVYKTKNVDGSDILASGCIIVPKDAPTPAMISIAHGDILNFDIFAPSYYNPGPIDVAAAYNEGSAAASNGYVTVLPDYIGYGTSNNLIHPPSHRSSLATSCADMIRAAEEFLSEKHEQWNHKLYLAGYSEGGFANLSLQKYIQDNHLPFNVKAASTGAAPCHISKIAQYIFNYPSDPGSVKNYLAVILFYNSFYPALHRPIEAYLVEPYASDIKTNGLINSSINVSLSSVLKPEFVNGINTGTDQAFINALQDNDVYDWKPVDPLRLSHSKDDEIIPYFNSEDAYNAMTARGAKNVNLQTLSGLTHDQAIEPYVLGSLEFFNSHP